MKSPVNASNLSRLRLAVSNRPMKYSASAVVVAVVVLGLYSSAQHIPRLPTNMAGVVNIPRLKQRPTKVVDPVYPEAAHQSWIQGNIVLDVVIDKAGAVEHIGCDEYCCMSPNSLIDAAVAAVRQWKWDPILVNGKPTRIRTQVAVNFVLDETSRPIDLCTVLHNPAFFDRRIVNVSGTVQMVHELKLLSSSHCSGSVVVADDSDRLRPLKNEKYSTFEDAVISKAITVSLRGEFQEDKSPGALGGKRLVLERVLQINMLTPQSH